MKAIELTKGYVALVDDEDYETLAKFAWSAAVRKSGYVSAARSEDLAGKRRIIYMHRQIMNEPENLYVDHRDRNPLNNTRANLRIATKSQNQANRRRAVSSVSGYKGVYWRAEKKRWVAAIRHNNKRIRLGMYKTAEEAAHAYDQKAREIYGEFALTNFDEVSYIATPPPIEVSPRLQIPKRYTKPPIMPAKKPNGFRGIYFDKTNNRWRAAICAYGKKYRLGRYKAPEDAARAYDAAARIHFGEHAELNFTNSL